MCDIILLEWSHPMDCNQAIENVANFCLGFETGKYYIGKSHLILDKLNKKSEIHLVCH